MDTSMVAKVISWSANHLTDIIALLWIADIVVGLTPTKYDDITLTVIKKALGKLLGRNLSKPNMWLPTKSKEE